MRTSRWAPSRFAAQLALVTLGGLALRLTYVLALRDQPVGGDGFTHHLGALLLADGRGFVEASPWGDGTRPDAHHAPLWRLLLALPSWLGWRSWLEHQLFASALGSATIVLVGCAGRRVAGARAGLVAAALAAVYPGLWVYERQLLSETLALLLAAGALTLSYRFVARPSAALAAALGGACGLLALTRPEQILLAPLLVAPLVLIAKADGRRRAAWLALAAATTLATLAPWTLYNLPRFERLVPLTTSLGNAMECANSEATYAGPLLGFYDGRFVNRHPELLALPPADPSVMSARKVRVSLAYMAAHRTRLPAVLLAREGRAWGFFRPFQQTRLDSDWRRTPLWVDRLGLFSYWALLAPALFGALALRRRAVPIFPLLAFALSVSAAVALTFGETRYRASAEVSLVLLAAAGIDEALRRFASARSEGPRRA